jgi:hypothetical protein
VDDATLFETRLKEALRRYAGDGPPVPDPMVVATSIAAAHRDRRTWPWVHFLGARPAARVGRLLLLGLLVGLTVAVGLLIGSALEPPDPAPIPAAQGVFTRTGSMQAAREVPTATRLEDGRVLVAGGALAPTMAEVWDPATEAFTPAGELTHARRGHTATLLRDGRVLVAGGIGPTARDGPVVEAEVWDPITSSFTEAGPLVVPRAEGTSVLLDDGRVRLSGGSDPATGDPVEDELWDPQTDGFAGAGHAVGPAGLRLTDGRTVSVDGSSLRIWDPVAGTSTPGGSLVEAHGSGWTATQLPDGRVLVAGGTSTGSGLELTSAELWDPATRASTPTGQLVEPRSGHTAVVLADGRVLIVGGQALRGRGTSAEIFELAP